MYCIVTEFTIDSRYMASDVKSTLSMQAAVCLGQVSASLPTAANYSRWKHKLNNATRTQFKLHARRIYSISLQSRIATVNHPSIEDNKIVYSTAFNLFAFAIDVSPYTLKYSIIIR